MKKEYYKTHLYFIGILMSLSITTSVQAALTDGLLLHYSFDNSCQALDLSGNGYDAAQEGFGIICGNGVSAYSPQAPQLTNVNDRYFATTTDDKLSVSTVTIAAWLKPLASSSRDGILWIRDPVSPYNTYGLRLSSLIPQFYANNGAAVESPKKLTVDGKWQHLAVTYEAVTVTTGTVTFYINGKKTSAHNANWPLPGLTGRHPNIYVGNDYNLGDSFTGFIDEVHLYSRALSALEIKQLYGEHTLLSGTIPNGSGKFTVKCQNITTGAQKIFTSLNAWNCETKGVTIAPGQKYQVTITGTKPTE